MATTERSGPSNAILTIPNLLSMFRLALVVPFLVLALGQDRIGPALALAGLGFITDLVDGPIARRTGTVSKLGIQLDPLSDRLGLAAGAAVLIVHDLAPLWAVLAVIARDGLLLAAAPVLKATRTPIPPVTRTGKNGSFAVSVAFGLFLASGIPGVEQPWSGVRTAGIAVFVVGIPLYYAAGLGYARVAIASLRSRGRG